MGAVSLRKGMTPVVAIVLLILMSVALLIAAWDWFENLQEEMADDIEDDVRTQLSVEMDCTSNGVDQVEFFIKNVGDQSVDASQVDVFIYDETGDLHNTVTTSWDTKNFTNPGGFDDATVPVTGPGLTAGAFYTVELAFPDFDVPEQGEGFGCVP